MKLALIGTGYVGLVSGACFAETGNDVVCLDVNQEKIDTLRAGKVPFFEPGLEELIRENVAAGRLTFTTDVAEGVRKCEVIFICVGTPPGPDGRADLSQVRSAAEAIGRAMNGYKVICTKSTVPVGTSDVVRETVAKFTDHPFDVVSNPEFLKEGAAVGDFMKPDRVIVGCSSDRARALMEELYEPFVRTNNPVVFMDVRSSEMTKYASNALLATRISFINEVAKLCEKVGANVSDVRRGMGADQRIGYQFLFPGVGYGGSCFPKDVKALIHTGEDWGVPMEILKAVDEVNQSMRALMMGKITEIFGDDLTGKHFALWGLSFKPMTDDIREAPALTILEELVKRGATVAGHDPVAMENVAKMYGDKIKLLDRAYDALDGAHALVISTEWNQFRTPDFDEIKRRLAKPVIFDGRNLYKPSRMHELGFTYRCVGVPV